MFRSAILILAFMPRLLLAQVHPAQDIKPQVDRDAVLRCGDMVQHLDGSIREGIGDVFLQAAAPPTSDGDKWFIYIVTMKGCQPCAALKEAWNTSEHLRAFAKPDDPKNSWAHFTTYDKDDRSQQHRWAKIKFTGFPTVIIQPPRSGKWGDPTTVVMQRAGYDGNPKKLATAMSNAIRRYSMAYRSKAKHTVWTEADDAAEEALAIARAGHEQPPLVGADPPWMPPDKDAPWAPGPNTPSPDFDIPPEDEGGSLLDSLGFGNVKGFASGVLNLSLSVVALLLSLTCPLLLVAGMVFAGVKAWQFAKTAPAGSGVMPPGPAPVNPQVSPAPPPLSPHVVYVPFDASKGGLTANVVNAAAAIQAHADALRAQADALSPSAPAPEAKTE